ncbi:hypothetical protein [Sagittula salina]|uniref:Uncharacterized protein n=1 Tax=Sagittula salina TaxID=2820268 RepID=A0A940MNJ4_9RHOB|nr:hypothetical protein [Sagittula salina]MBP0481808.1 hypothetical protein [Sagittula salina]
MQVAGYYTLVHASSGLTMLASTAAGASAAGTTGIIAGTSGAVGGAAAVLMAPATVIAGALAAVGVGGYEGVCWFYVDRITDQNEVNQIVESIASRDPYVTIEGWGDKRSMVIREGDNVDSYRMNKLYIADGMLKHRSWGPNPNIGSVLFQSGDE